MTGLDLDRIARGLPAAAVHGDLQAAFTDGRAPRLVIEAPPGSGKTTFVPPAITQLAPGRVIVTEPRRVAARAAAKRLAGLTGTRVGGFAGYSVRGERRVGSTTRVEFVTSGLMLRRLLADPELAGVSAVVLDEVHERDLDADLVFAMVEQIGQLRDDLAVVAMSATLDAQAWASLLGRDARILRVPMTPHPLQRRFAPPPAGADRLDERGVPRAFLTHVARTARAALDERADGSVLVFAPGLREVEAITGMLRDAGVEALPLHGSMTPAAQDAVLSPTAPTRRVIVATSIAESSVTVPDVRVVVDAGLAREPRMDARRGMAGLVTVAASQAAVAQRAGRAARLGPGVSIFCGTEQALALAPAHSRPQIATADLTSAALALAAWGDPEARELHLPDRPPPAALAAAQQTLLQLGALERDAQGVLHLTPSGRRLARVPAHPRLARALFDAAGLIGSEQAARLVAVVDSDGRAPQADLTALLRQLRHGRDAAAHRWSVDARRLTALVHPADATGAAPSLRLTDDEALGLVAGLAHPEQLARNRGNGRWLLASGTGAVLPPGSALAGGDWLAVAEVTRGGTRDTSGAVIRAAAPISAQLAELAGAPLLRDELRPQWREGRLRAERVRGLGAIVLSRTPARLEEPAALPLVRQALTGDGHAGAPLAPLLWSDAADQLRRRLALLHRVLGSPWPAVDDAALAARLDEWLAPQMRSLAAGAAVSSLDLAEALRRLLPWPEAGRLSTLAPERLEVPSGSHISVAYPALDEAHAAPVLAVRLQECFGWQATPRLVDGRVPVQLQLLSPAGRPLAITMDLASFWAGPYAQVRSEMRGRYPKHAWPEDPMTAAPTRGTGRRRPAGG